LAFFIQFRSLSLSHSFERSGIGTVIHAPKHHVALTFIIESEKALKIRWPPSYAAFSSASNIMNAGALQEAEPQTNAVSG
jgi:hypothetical protein